MATATETLPVNYKVLREIRLENQSLKNLIARLHRLSEQSLMQDHRPSHFVGLLGKLCDEVALHFSLEEAYGYFDDAIEIAPRLADRAEALRNEHETLFNTIRQISDDGDAALAHGRLPTLIVHLVHQFREFELALQEHESRETALMLEAFDDDIGVGD